MVSTLCPGLCSGSLCIVLQAILGDATDAKLGLNIKANRDLLKMVAKDAPGQIALLIALEYFLAVVNPGQIEQVGAYLLHQPNSPLTYPAAVIYIRQSRPQARNEAVQKHLRCDHQASLARPVWAHCSSPVVPSQSSAATEPSLQVQVMHVLKALCDNEVVEEDIILAWHGRPGTGKALGVLPADAEKVRKAATTYIEWLEEEAESESESEEEED